MVDLYANYLGGLRCEAKHGPSGNTLVTDAPVDNKGKGETFSPTDLVATALGTCLLTIMAMTAEENGVVFTGAKVQVLKEMSADPPRRIARLPIRVEMPAGLNPECREKLEQAAHACPVKQSLHPDIEIPLEFIYPD